MKLRVLLTALLSIPAWFAPCDGAAQEDLAGSSDHPLVSRYAGSHIVRCDSRKFDAFELLTGAVSTSNEDCAGRTLETVRQRGDVRPEGVRCVPFY